MITRSGCAMRRACLLSVVAASLLWLSPPAAHADSLEILGTTEDGATVPPAKAAAETKFAAIDAGMRLGLGKITSAYPCMWPPSITAAKRR